MGSACCVAARDRTIINGSGGEVMPRNVRYSPSWSFRWDNRGRVAEEEVSVRWLSDGVGTNDRLDNKSPITVETAYASEEGSPLEGSRNLCWQKSSPSEGNLAYQSGSLNSRNPPVVKELRETTVASEPSPTKMSPPPPHIVSSFSTSPFFPSQVHLPPPSLAIRPPPYYSPRRPFLRQVSSRYPGMKSPRFSISEEGSPFMLPGRNNRQHMWSLGGSSDDFSSFDSESLSFTGVRDSSPSFDTRTCSACTRFLTEKSAWTGQKLMASNELAVVAILICGHVYHAECLENITPGVDKYDPTCPVCTYGEKQTLKLSEKALRAQMDLKTKITRKFRCRPVDRDLVLFDRSPRMSLSSSLKNSLGKPFLRKHFSFGSKGSRSMSESKSSRRKGFFWARSSKE